MLGKIQSSCSYGAHVCSKGTTVAGEPLNFLLTQAELEFRRENATSLPPVVSDACHAMVDIGQKTSLVTFQTGMSQLDT